MIIKKIALFGNRLFYTLYSAKRTTVINSVFIIAKGSSMKNRIGVEIEHFSKYKLQAYKFITYIVSYLEIQVITRI